FQPALPHLETDGTRRLGRFRRRSAGGPPRREDLSYHTPRSRGLPGVAALTAPTLLPLPGQRTPGPAGLRQPVGQSDYLTPAPHRAGIPSGAYRPLPSPRPDDSGIGSERMGRSGTGALFQRLDA